MRLFNHERGRIKGVLLPTDFAALKRPFLAHPSTTTILPMRSFAIKLIKPITHLSTSTISYTHAGPWHRGPHSLSKINAAHA